MNIEWFGERKEFIVTGGVVFVALGFLISIDERANLNPILQSVIASALIFLVLPLLYCKMVLKRPWASLGIRTGSVWSGIGGSLIALTSGLVALFGLIQFTPLFDDMRLPLAVEQNFFIFLLYEVMLNGWITLLLEVFFRGLVMLVWLRRIGFLAVILQAVLFGGLVLLTGDLTPQMIPLVLFAPLAGLIAYQSRSIYASWGASWFFVFLADVIFLIKG